jgi:ribosomal protein L24E
MAAASALTAFPAATRAGATAATPYTGAYFDGSAGNQIGGTSPSSFSTVTPESSLSSDVQAFDLSGNGQSWTVTFAAKTTDSGLATGTYKATASSASSTSPGLSVVQSGGSTCTNQTGMFTINDITPTVGGVSSFSAIFEVECNGASGALYGEVSYASTTPFIERTVSSNQLAFQSSINSGGTDKTLTITNTGSGDDIFPASDLQILGTQHQSFNVQSDNCADHTLTTGQSCSIVVEYRPASGSTSASATLYFEDSLTPIDSSATASAPIGAGRSIPLSGQVTNPSLTGLPSSKSFDYQRVGTYNSTPTVLTLVNKGAGSLSIFGVDVTGANASDWTGSTTCGLNTLATNQSCTITLVFSPLQFGNRTAELVVDSNDPKTPTISVKLTGFGTEGYYLVSNGGQIAYGGDAQFEQDLSGAKLAYPVVGMTPTPNGAGYWLVAKDGGIFAFGDAHFYGSTGGIRLAQPIVGMTATPDGKGYWFVAADGGIFAFGDAHFYGSTGGVRLAKPIVGMAATSDGKGYWLVASDGGVFAFGDARFHGSTGGIALNKPIVGMTSTPTGNGYWMVASDGGIFAFGDAHFYGSTGNVRLAQPIVGMAPTPDGRGYWFVAADGGIFNYGDAPFFGSLGGAGIDSIVGMAPTAPPLYTLVNSKSAARPANRDRLATRPLPDDPARALPQK